MIGRSCLSVSRVVAVVSVFGFSLVVQGCTRQAWFAGMKARERQECQQQMSDHDIQQCLERVDSTKID